MMRRWTRELRRWIRECFPVPAAARYEPRHLALVPEPRTEPIAFLDIARTNPQFGMLAAGLAIGSLTVYDPALRALPAPSDLPARVHDSPGGEPEPPRLTLVSAADALFDAELAWHDAMKRQQRGDDEAMGAYLAAGWLADPWWIRAAA